MSGNIVGELELVVVSFDLLISCLMLIGNLLVKSPGLYMFSLCIVKGSV